MLCIAFRQNESSMYINKKIPALNNSIFTTMKRLRFINIFYSVKLKSANPVMILIICLVSILLANRAFAQPFYMDVSSGYALNMMPKVNTDVYINTLSTSAPLKISGSFGKGLNYGGSAGYFILPYMAFEVGVNDFIGGKLSSSQIVPINNTQSLTLSESSKGSMLRICPMLKFCTFDGQIPPYNNNTPREGGSWVDYYAKVGLIIGIKNTITSNQNLLHNDTTSSLAYTTTTVYSGGTSTGINCILGASFKQNNGLYFFVELSFINQLYSPAQSEITAYSYNGTDLLNTLSVSQTQTNYTAKSSNSGGGSNEPLQAPTVTYPFTSIGLNVGIEFHFNR